MANPLASTLGFLRHHKLLAALAVAAVAAVGYWGVRARSGQAAETRYVLGEVTRGTIVASVSGSGQVSALQQVELKAKASGDLVTVNVVAGQSVRAGQVIAQVNASDVQKAVRDAQASLESVKLSLKKLLQPADALTVIQAEHSLQRAQESRLNAAADLKKAYDDGFNRVANAYLDLPAMMAGLQSLLYTGSTGLGGAGQWNIDYYTDIAVKYDERARQHKTDVNTKYEAARAAYESSFAAYQTTSRVSDPARIEAVIQESYAATRDIAEAVKSAINLIQFYQDTLVSREFKPAALADTHLGTLTTYTSQTNTHLINLLASVTAIADARQAIVNAERTITESTESLAKLKAGADALDAESAQLAVRQRENALADAQARYADYTVRAPIEGVIAEVAVKRSDAVSSGTTVATLITQRKIAEIALNEVDITKAKVGQKATLTFDAVVGLGISGEVVEVAVLGTVSQGVVSYPVTIGFDTQDDRIRSGMSASAAIITDVKADALLVPSSAIKSQGDASYVEVLDAAGGSQTGSEGIASDAPPRQQTVEVGLSNDTQTQVLSGLSVGDSIVVRTVTPSTNAARVTAPSLFPTGGTRGAGGGGMRFIR